jgi:hypothetical protein
MMIMGATVDDGDGRDHDDHDATGSGPTRSPSQTATTQLFFFFFFFFFFFKTLSAWERTLSPSGLNATSHCPDTPRDYPLCVALIAVMGIHWQPT